jgi:hypothetical protein
VVRTGLPMTVRIAVADAEKVDALIVASARNVEVLETLARAGHLLHLLLRQLLHRLLSHQQQPYRRTITSLTSARSAQPASSAPVMELDVASALEKIARLTAARFVAVDMARVAARSAVNARAVAAPVTLAQGLSRPPQVLQWSLLRFPSVLFVSTIPDHIRVVAAILMAQRTVGAVAIVAAAVLLVVLALTGLAVEAPTVHPLNVWLALPRSRQLATRIWCSRPTALQ